jgi:hypothetical protein
MQHILRYNHNRVIHFFFLDNFATRTRVRSPGRTTFFLLLVLIILSARVVTAGQRPYHTVLIFDNQVEIAVPRGSRKIRKKIVDDPFPYAIVQQIGFRDKRGTVVRLYCTKETYPHDEHGIMIWDILERLTSHIENKVQLKSGFVLVDRQKWLLGGSKDLFFIKIMYLNPAGAIEYALVMCVELKGKLMVCIIQTPSREFIDNYENDFCEALHFSE